MKLNHQDCTVHRERCAVQCHVGAQGRVVDRWTGGGSDAVRGIFGWRCFPARIAWWRGRGAGGCNGRRGGIQRSNGQRARVNFGLAYRLCGRRTQVQCLATADVRRMGNRVAVVNVVVVAQGEPQEPVAEGRAVSVWRDVGLPGDHESTQKTHR